MAKLAVLVRPMVQGTHTDSTLTTADSICIPPAQARADAQPERQGRHAEQTALTLNSKFKYTYFFNAFEILTLLTRSRIDKRGQLVRLLL